ncbi:MAG: hypothetical protein G01um101419_869, partial [Parcubacteria group bacterium Gr01-1014_19]
SFVVAVGYTAASSLLVPGNFSSQREESLQRKRRQLLYSWLGLPAGLVFGLLHVLGSRRENPGGID